MTARTAIGLVLFFALFGVLACAAWAEDAEPVEGEPAPPAVESGLPDLPGTDGPFAEDAETLFDTNAATIVTRAQIRRLDVDNAAEVLEHLSFVHVTLDEAGETAFRIRGYEMRETAVLVDGIPLIGQYDRRSQLEMIPASAIDRIVIAPGAGTVAAGPGSLAGAIHVHTRSSAPGNQMRAGGRVSTAGEPRFDLTAWGSLAKRIGYALGASYQQSDGFEMSDNYDVARNEDGEERNNSDRRLTRFLGKIDYTPADISTVFFTFDYQDAEYGIPPHTKVTDPDFLRIEPYRRWTLGVGDILRVGNDIELSLRFFAKERESSLKAFDDDTFTSMDQTGYSLKIDEVTIGGQHTGDFDLGPYSRLRYSLWYQRDTHKQRLSVNQPWTKYVTDTFSIGVEDRIRPHEDVTLVAGVSLDGLIQHFASGVDEKEPSWGINGLLGIGYQPFNYTRIFANAYRRVRLPDQSELFGLSPYLDPETVIGGEAGWEQGIFEYADLSWIGFLSTPEDMIRVAGTGPENDGRAIHVGTTITADVHPWSWFDWSSSYTYLEAENRTDGQDERLQFKPAHKFVTHLKLTSPTGLEGDLRFLFVGEQDFVDPRGGVWKTLGEYYTLDLRLAQRLFSHFTLFGSVENVLDYNYESQFGYPRRGRTIWLGLQIDADLQGPDYL